MLYVNEIATKIFFCLFVLGSRTLFFLLPCKESLIFTLYITLHDFDAIVLQ